MFLWLPQESPAPVSWAKLLVISNVPVTPSGPSDVQKLVRRFGTVIKTLVLNSMVTAHRHTLSCTLNCACCFMGHIWVMALYKKACSQCGAASLPSQVICEMATVALAQSVYKRFQTFPCIIHNNPLFFSRKADPRANAQSKVITAYLDPPEVSSFAHKWDMIVNSLVDYVKYMAAIKS